MMVSKSGPWHASGLQHLLAELTPIPGRTAPPHLPRGALPSDDSRMLETGAPGCVLWL